jgi:hypothetical protein
MESLAEESNANKELLLEKDKKIVEWKNQVANLEALKAKNLESNKELKEYNTKLTQRLAQLEEEMV